MSAVRAGNRSVQGEICVEPRLAPRQKGYANCHRLSLPAQGATARHERNLSMKVSKTAVKTAIAAGGIAATSVFAAATASAAPPNIQGFGTSEQLVDGPLITNYTVSNLQPSNAAIPGYTPKGTLYQADVTAKSE